MPHDAKTAEVLEALPGGRELLAWTGGIPNFGDAEVLGLTLDRSGASELRILVISADSAQGASGLFKKAIVTFTLRNMIDVSLEGFGHQNVIGGLKIRRAPAKQKHPSLFGIGIVDSEHEIELAPCAGAFGTIRATIASLSIDPLS
jgi:hypothetical protein